MNTIFDDKKDNQDEFQKSKYYKKIENKIHRKPKEKLRATVTTTTA